MSTHTATCSGPCVGAEPLAYVELPDDTPAEFVARALDGYLCEDCGHVYRYLVARHGHPPGVIPTAEQTARHLDEARAAWR